MSGAGNDFVVVDNRTGIISDPKKFSIKVAERRFGIGADGVLLLETAKNADFTMKYYNADGSNAGMCGNGGRCLSKFAYDNGIVTKEIFKFEGFGHIYTAQRVASDRYKLKMKDPFDVRLHQKIDLENLNIEANYINTGTDHSVIFLDSNPFLTPVTAATIENIGRLIRNHETYKPLGANVNFVLKNSINQIEIRTYERGVEAETLACGTGSVACALLSTLKYNFESPVTVKVLSGESLQISFQRDGSAFNEIYLEGSAVTTYVGEIEI
jgi:diaminopimelate epimerase